MTSIFEDDTSAYDLMRDDLKAALTALDKPTAETLAKATYEVLRKHAKLQGQNPDIEVSIKRPGEPRHFANEQSWVVVWEAGPYEWAIPISMAIGTWTGKLAEPYYSFDLCFYPGED